MMKRFWPLAFLTLLFVALLARPSLIPARPAPHVPRIPAEPVPIVVAPPPTPPAPPTEIASQTPLGQSAVGAGLLWLARNQNEDGSWGDAPATVGGRTIGKTGVTSLALLSFFGAGYSHLSRDEFDGPKTMGAVVRKALQWMLKDQREDGTFQSGYDVAFDQVLATLASCEAYGMTASQPLKEPAERALDAMVRMQGSDGSWGGPEETAWAVHAIFSAESGDLYYPRIVREQALQFIDRTPHPGNALSRIFLTLNRASGAADAAALASSLPQGDGRDFCEWFHASYGVHQADGPDGPLWKKFNEPMKNAILPLQQRNGSWQGGTLSHTIVRTSLAELTLQVYYRYANVVSAAR